MGRNGLKSCLLILAAVSMWAASVPLQRAQAQTAEPLSGFPVRVAGQPFTDSSLLFFPIQFQDDTWISVLAAGNPDATLAVLNQGYLTGAGVVAQGEDLPPEGAVPGDLIWQLAESVPLPGPAYGPPTLFLTLSEEYTVVYTIGQVYHDQAATLGPARERFGMMTGGLSLVRAWLDLYTGKRYKPSSNSKSVGFNRTGFYAPGHPPLAHDFNKDGTRDAIFPSKSSNCNTIKIDVVDITTGRDLTAGSPFDSFTVPDKGGDGLQSSNTYLTGGGSTADPGDRQPGVLAGNNFGELKDVTGLGITDTGLSDLFTYSIKCDTPPAGVTLATSAPTAQGRMDIEATGNSVTISQGGTAQATINLEAPISRMNSSAGMNGGGDHSSIVVVCSNGKLYSYDFNGKLLWYMDVENRADPKDGAIPRQSILPSDAVAADVTGDGVPEILFSAKTEVIVLDAQGNEISGPGGSSGVRYDTGAALTSSPVVADINNDGLLEIAVAGSNSDGGGWFWAWPTPAPASSPRPWPMAYHDAYRTASAP